MLTILGNLVHEWFFAFHLIDALLRYKDLNLVLLSVYRPIRALLTTAALFFVLTCAPRCANACAVPQRVAHVARVTSIQHLFVCVLVVFLFNECER